MKETYFDFAEESYIFIKNIYKTYDFENNTPPNDICFLIDNTIERYLKHLVSLFVCPKTKVDAYDKERIMQTYSNEKLLKYLKSNGIIENDKIIITRGYYFNTRYPGDDSVEVQIEDIQESMKMLEIIRNMVIQILENKI